MSTLPFLLSVADELDNLNSQSYMDDFGLGFHPHRHYYRNPSIQLSLPASTDWLEQKRSRCFKFVEEEDAEETDDNNPKDNSKNGKKQDDTDNSDDNNDDGHVRRHIPDDDELQSLNSQDLLVGKKDKSNRKHTYSSVFQKMKQSPRTSNDSSNNASVTPNTATTAVSGSGSGSGSRSGSRSKSGSGSSTDDFQSETSSIEFLTCFPMKKSKLLKSISGSRK